MIKLETAWEIIRNNAQIAFDAKTVFTTPRSDVTYQVQQVDKDKITVLTQRENKSFGRRKVQNQFEKLNTAGGTLHYREFVKNVAMGTIMIMLHPQLDFDHSGQFVIDKAVRSA